MWNIWTIVAHALNSCLWLLYVWASEHECRAQLFVLCVRRGTISVCNFESYLVNDGEFRPEKASKGVRDGIASLWSLMLFQSSLSPCLCALCSYSCVSISAATHRFTFLELELFPQTFSVSAVLHYADMARKQSETSHGTGSLEEFPLMVPFRMLTCQLVIKRIQLIQNFISLQ